MILHDRNPLAPPPCLHRCFAALGVALVLLLSASVFAPALHESLHGDHADHSGADRCAVVLFASGVTLAFAAIAVAAPAPAWRQPVARRGAEIFLVSPRYLRQPERGPPAV